MSRHKHGLQGRNFKSVSDFKGQVGITETHSSGEGKKYKKKRVKNTLWQLGGERKRRKGGKKKNEKLEVPAREKRNIRGLRALLTHENTP